MSFTVDDLAAAFGQNHIGQEALDIEALHVRLPSALPSFLSILTPTILLLNLIQAQLAQALAGPSAATPTRAQPLACTTPTTTHPAPSSYTLNWSATSHRSTGAAGTTTALDADAEDERMVEDLLMSAGPASPALAPLSPFGPAPMAASPHTDAAVLERGGSTFATSDPFYLALLAQQQGSSPISMAQGGMFASAARPAQASPFMRTHHHHHQQPVSQPAAFAAFQQAFAQPTALFAFNG
jgi:hypothetical protein